MARGAARGIATSAGCTALAYLAVGLPLAVLPGWVLALGFGPVIAGAAVSVQYAATIVSRLIAGAAVDRSAPRRTILAGFRARTVASRPRSGS